MTSTTEETTVGIRETVETAVTSAGYGSYMRYAGPVIEALDTRERGLSDKLIDFAVDSGADELEVRTYLREIGMVVADPPAEDTEDESDDEDQGDGVADMLRRIDERLNSLTDFARANGYRG